MTIFALQIFVNFSFRFVDFVSLVFFSLLISSVLLRSKTSKKNRFFALKKNIFPLIFAVSLRTENERGTLLINLSLFASLCHTRFFL
jgi:hypothetical protein